MSFKHTLNRLWDNLVNYDVVSYKKDLTVRHSRGGFLSIILACIVFVFSSIRFGTLLFNDELNSSRSTSTDTTGIQMALPSFVLELSDAETIDYSKYFQINAAQFSVINGVEQKTFDLVLSPCNVSVWDSFSVFGWCNNSMSIFAQGVYGDATFSFFSFQLIRCSNTTSSVVCASSQDIEKFIITSSTKLSLWLNNRNTFNDYKWISPVYQNVNGAYWLGIEVYFNFERSITSNRFVGSNIQEYVSYNDFSLRTDILKSNQGQLMTLYLRMSGAKDTTISTRYQLLDWLTELGAALSIAVFVGKIYGLKFAHSPLQRERSREDGKSYSRDQVVSPFEVI